MAATISLAQVLEVALTGDDKAIRKWVETQLPIAKPMDIKSEHSSTPVCIGSRSMGLRQIEV